MLEHQRSGSVAAASTASRSCAATNMPIASMRRTIGRIPRWPDIFAEGARTRRPRHFGASSRDQASELFSFWANARRGELDPIFRMLGLSTLRSSLPRLRSTEQRGTAAGSPFREPLHRGERRRAGASGFADVDTADLTTRGGEI
jgi:hypothetical protein